MPTRVYLSTWTTQQTELGTEVVSKVDEIVAANALPAAVSLSYSEVDPATGFPLGTDCIATVDTPDHTAFQGVAGITDITV